MEQGLRITIISLGFALLLCIPICIPIILAKKREDEFCEKHRKIRPGMSKDDVIDIFGENYTISYLKNGVEKLEWRLRHSGYSGRVAKGVYTHSSSFTRKISVKIKDDQVIEVNSLNMD